MKGTRLIQHSFLTVLAILLILPVRSAQSADTPTLGFVRQMGTYPLDAKGSHLRIHAAKDGKPTYEFKWIIPRGHEKDSAPGAGFFQGTGWFAYIESSSRIWIYDGKKDLNIVHRKEKGVGFYSVAAKEYYPSCPAEVWAALPENVRTTLQKIGAAAGQK